MNKKIENWAKNNPIKSFILLYPLSELLKFISDKVQGVNYASLLGYLIAFLNIDFNVKTWHVLFIIVIIILSIVLIRSKRQNHQVETKINILEGLDIGFANSSFNSSITSSFLDTKNGVFSIWGHVSDIHNKIQPEQHFMYLIGYATNNGNELNNPSLANYPNAWAIQRVTPTPSDHNGIWRFWCNNISKPQTLLDYSKPLSGGWHLFSVAWSSESNYIKFVIDNLVIGQKPFENWPSDFSKSVVVGTWPNKSPDHYFASKIGPWRFTPSSYDSNLINDYFSKKPDQY